MVSILVMKPCLKTYTFSTVLIIVVRLCSAQQIERILENGQKVYGAEFSWDGSKMAAGTQREVIVWDTVTGMKLVSFDSGEFPYGSLAFSPDGTFLLGGHKFGYATLWNLKTGNMIRSFAVPEPQPYNEPTYVVSSVAFSPDGRMMATIRNYTLTFWDIASGDEIKRGYGLYPSGRDVDFGQLILFEDGKRVFAYDEGLNSPSIKNCETGETLFVFPGQACLTHDKQIGFSFSKEESNCFRMNIDSRDVVDTYNTDCRGHRPALSPDGNYLIYSDYTKFETLYVEALKGSGFRIPLKTFGADEISNDRVQATRYSPLGDRALIRKETKVYLLDMSELQAAIPKHVKYKQ